MGDQQGDAGVFGQVALQFGAGVRAGAGVQRGESSRSSVVCRASARTNATRWASPPESWRGFAAGVLGEADAVEPLRGPFAVGAAVDAVAAGAERDIVQRA